MSEKSAATASANSNIALVKYWGKRDAARNLPAADSLSMTLDRLTTTTTVEFDPEFTADELILNGEKRLDADLDRLSQWLDLVRARSGKAARARVTSTNNFPTASGLASSASAYAALAAAACAATGLALSAPELSALARRGSGSAARSIFGGIVVMRAGQSVDGADCVAQPIDDLTDWPLRMVIAVIGGGQRKHTSSRDAMVHCQQTSPLYRAWLDCVAPDIQAAIDAIKRRSLGDLGAVVEGSTMAMHAAAMASRPATLFWQPSTIAAIAAIADLRGQGTPCFATIDAGPHVKALTLADHIDSVREALARVPGVSTTLTAGVGRGVTLHR